MKIEHKNPIIMVQPNLKMNKRTEVLFLEKRANQFSNPWTKEEKGKLRSLVSKGCSNKEIANIIGHSEKSVSMQKWRSGLKNATPHRRYKNKAWLEQKYIKEGYSTLDIGEMVGINHATVSRWLKQFGIELRTFNGTNTERQNKKIGEALSKYKGELSPHWRGGKTKTNEGYVYVRVHDHPFGNANNSVLEHRLVMEEHLGRFLKDHEVVHHINGKVDDNRIENLFLFKTGGDHNKFHAMERKIGNGAEMKYEYQ